MTWAAAIQYGKDFLTVAALVGAFWSAVVFVRKVASDREAARRASVASWLKVEIHKVIATSEQMLNVDEVVAALRKASFVTPIVFTKDDLSESNVRLQLLAMVESKVLGQRWPERFRISQLPFDVTGQLTVDMVKGNQAVRKAFGLIKKYPGHYDDARLWQELGPESELSEADFFLALTDLHVRKLARKSADGRWTDTALSFEAVA
jgi:hypothetical protein